MTRRSKLYTYEGRSLTMDEWAKVAGISTQLLRQRLYLKWDFGRAIHTPNTRYRYEINGHKYDINEIAIMNRTISVSGIRSRLKRGMSLASVINTPNKKMYKITNKNCPYECLECPYPDPPCIK